MGRDQNSHSQAGWAAEDTGDWVVPWIPTWKSSPIPVPTPFSAQKLQTHVAASQTPSVITDPLFLLGFHLFNHPFSSASNTLSSVKGQKPQPLHPEGQEFPATAAIFNRKNTLGCHSNPGFYK